MKKTLVALSLLAGVSLAGAAPVAPAASTPAPPTASTTLELDVIGLNCSLCTAAMKVKLMKLAGARDIEPRLECGKIYLDMPAGAKFNDRSLSATLLENGFTLEGAKPTNRTLAQVRKTPPESCS
jgi:hypothetical protein